MDQLTNSLVGGGKEWLTLTIVALLPAFWTLSLMLYLGRPYMMRTLRKFGLRFGADVWWLSYVLIRDAVLIVTFVMSFILLLPDLALNLALPLTGPLAALLLFWALVVKITRDPDDKAGDYKMMTALLVASAALFLIPLVLGPESNFEDAALTNFLTTQSNQAVLHLHFDVVVGHRYIPLESIGRRPGDVLI